MSVGLISESEHGSQCLCLKQPLPPAPGGRPGVRGLGSYRSTRVKELGAALNMQVKGRG